MSRDEVKVEASMPVQSRVDLRVLAELAVYWEKQGIAVNTMSRLVAWSLDALRMILDKNGALQYKIETLEMAYDVLSSKKMLQGSMKERMKSKYEKSRAMENLRLDGWSSEVAGGRFYEELHPKNEVEPFPGSLEKVSDEEYKRVTGLTREEVNRISYTPQIKQEVMDKQKERFIYDKNGIYIGMKPEADRSIVHESDQPLTAAEVEKVNVERNLKKMKEADDKLKNM